MAHGREREHGAAALRRAPTGARRPSARSSAAVYFKNLVKKGWDVDPESKETPVAAGDRDAIKSHMVTLVCACGKFGGVKQQLSQALTLIASTDFPGKWPNLLPEIVARFADGDAATSGALYAELKCALDTLAAPLTRLFGTLGEELRAAAGDAARSAVALESLRLACRVFFSLNWQDLPEFFEDHMAPWMGAFQEFLAYEAPGAAADDEDDDEGPVERLQAAVVERAGKSDSSSLQRESNASLYAHKYEEEFQPHLPQFVSGIWQRLMKTSLFPKHDRLAATSMRFLAEVVGQQMHALFADESTLRQVVEAIVIPNMTLRDSDVELFEDNAVEYISRDLESADSETRRRGARDLVHAMCKHHDATTTKICGEHVAAMLGRYGASPGTEWRAKDARSTSSCAGKIHRPQLAPLLPALFQALFAVIDGALAKGGDAPWENEYVMKAVMRLLVVGQADVVPHAAVVAEKLCSVLQMDVVEFAPYASRYWRSCWATARRGRVWGRLRGAPAAAAAPVALGAPGQRVPALAALLEAYLVAGPDQILAAGQLEPMLGVFQKLLASKASEGHAFGLLKSLVVHVRGERIWTTAPGGARPGARVLGEAAAFASAVDAKAAAVGAVKLLAEAPDALTPNGDTSAWSCLGSVLFALLKRLAGAALAGDATIDRSDDVPDELLAGYDATFSKLHFGTQKSDDAFAEIPDTQTRSP
ncbi:nuclear export signal receptor [Aureococcus anophagefferens]|uniref:Nuclear export signal receptor n=1 Tax=Aureococcus anophagefferens TaxID=44056 RepID=A0ABR1FHW1_AURAN